MRIETLEIAGFSSAIKGMRNPLNSWGKSDSYTCVPSIFTPQIDYVIGTNDLNLAQSLIKAGSEHSKFLRQIQVWADFDMPRYWWSEMDTYHFNSKNSCSTMHKLLNKEFPITLDMFAVCDEDIDTLKVIVDKLNKIREQFLSATDQNTKDYLLLRAKRLLPEGLLQLRTVNTNYTEIRNIWLQRVNHPHRLKEEWVETFGEWVLSLPYAKELIMYKGGE